MDMGRHGQVDAVIQLLFVSKREVMVMAAPCLPFCGTADVTQYHKTLWIDIELFNSPCSSLNGHLSIKSLERNGAGSKRVFDKVDHGCPGGENNAV